MFTFACVLLHGDQQQNKPPGSPSCQRLEAVVRWERFYHTISICLHGMLGMGINSITYYSPAHARLAGNAPRKSARSLDGSVGTPPENALLGAFVGIVNFQNAHLQTAVFKSRPFEREVKGNSKFKQNLCSAKPCQVNLTVHTAAQCKGRG